VAPFLECYVLPACLVGVSLVACGARTAPDPGSGSAAPDAGDALADEMLLRDSAVPDAILPDGPPCAERPPRLVAPLSTLRLTTRRPTLLLEPGTAPGSTQVQLCADRSCGRVLEEVVTTGGPARPAGELPLGVVFWRASSRGCSPAQRLWSHTWEFSVPARSASHEAWTGRYVDINGDGLADLMAYDVRAPQENAFPVLFGARDGLALRPATLSLDATGIGCVFSTYLGDVNGDGFGDAALFVRPLAAPTAHLEVSYGDGAEPLRRRGILVATERYPFVFPLDDVNGDGYADVGTFLEGPNVLHVYFGSSIGPIPSRLRIEAPEGESIFRAGSIGDPDSDGRAEFTARVARTPTLFDFTGTALVPTPLMISRDVALGAGAAGDLDGDGHVDIFAGLSVVDYLRGAGLGSGGVTQLARRDYAGSGCGAVLWPLGDTNGDGYDDMAENDCVDVTFLRGGPATWPAGTERLVLPPHPPLHPWNIRAAGDVDGDGIDDAVGSSAFQLLIVHGARSGSIPNVEMRPWPVFEAAIYTPFSFLW